MEHENIDARLAAEVTHLSTKLVTEVAKLLRLEETVVQLRKENSILRQKQGSSHDEPSPQNASELQNRIDALLAEKNTAEEKNKQLEAEVEDLTASLFNEANEMVLNASRETYNYKLKNRKLIEEIGEKDAIIDNLQDQLKDLKAMFLRMEDQLRSRGNTPRTENVAVFDDLDGYHDLMQLVLYGPKARAVRFDLPGYQQDFKSFVYQLIKPDFVFDLASLKNLRYFRRIWLEEIEPCVSHIPAVGGNFMNRFSKGKTFWNILVEGRAIIEPVSGINETFKLTYKGAKTGEVWDTRLSKHAEKAGMKTPSDLPVAVLDACAFCGENKDDMLEHARLYFLKLYSPVETGGSGTTRDIGGEQHEVVDTYPLCNFCLVKLRAICDFFARLRMIHANIYKLQQNNTYDDLAFVSNFQFKRNDIPMPKLNAADEPAMVKLYTMLLVIRAKIFWSKIGIWDTDDDVDVVLMDEVDMDIFRQFVRDNVAFRLARESVVGASDEHAHKQDIHDAASAGKDPENVNKDPESTQNEIGKDPESAEGSKSGNQETDMSHKHEDNVPANDTDITLNKTDVHEGVDSERDAINIHDTKMNASNRTSHSGSDSEEFADTSELLNEPRAHTSLRSQIDKDLDLTMAKLQQSIDL